jgi:hypothetical protein
MKKPDAHLSDQQVLLHAEGELSAREENLVRAHLHACWKCRVRGQELESAIVDFVRIHQRDLDAKVPPGGGPRALLRARIAQLSAAEPGRRLGWFSSRATLAGVAAICVVLALGLFSAHSTGGRQHPARGKTMVVSIPDSRLTPGAMVFESRSAVCAGTNMKNKPVSASVQRKVFEEYGIVGVDPRAARVGRG